MARCGAREALVVRHQQRRYTYDEFNAAVDLLARGLMRRGLAMGDRVGIWSPNCAEWVLVQYATAKIGAILVNINPAYRTSEVEYALSQSRCRSARRRRGRPAQPAHRDHGRSALSGGDDEAGDLGHEHDRGHHLLRDDRDLTGVDPDDFR